MKVKHDRWVKRRIVVVKKELKTAAPGGKYHSALERVLLVLTESLEIPY
jgi:hypothetical protein